MSSNRDVHDYTVEIMEVPPDELIDPAASESAGCTLLPDDNPFKIPVAPVTPLSSKSQQKSPGYALKFSMPGHASCVTSVKFSPDGEYLTSASADWFLKQWDVETASLIQSMTGHNHGINDVTWAPVGRTLATCSDDKTVKLWDVRSGRCQMTLEGHGGFTFSCRFNPQGNLLASTSFDETVRLWDIRTGRTLKTVPAHLDPISSVDFNRDGSLFVTSSFDGLVRIWDATTCQVLKTLIDDDNTPVGHVKFAPNGKYILTSTMNNTLKLWNFQKPKCLRSYRGHKNEVFCMTSNFSITAGIWIISGSEDLSICIWNLQTKELVQKVDTQGDQVLCTDCHPTANLIASGSLQNNYEVKIWQSTE
ncbi:uncharacterized protein Dana_GF11669 [Drosophila ananassae]|uniref:WDR5-like beta-propeller domain-containing protein n=1 Tax=Drosophila ananassae TaxID=7217 RepID=B3MIC8_DROAN|nr:WD repeat-containing protein 5 [Drosophila ananassae]EDV36976.1 uncharacterized protein Dana_GF11669 [Drosophila ananassae]